MVNNLKLDFVHGNYRFITDDTSKLDNETLFLHTSQNDPYYEKLEVKPKSISPEALIDIWELSKMKVVGVTGTNGKTTVTAAIYSFLLDLDEKPLTGYSWFICPGETIRREEYDYSFHIRNITQYEADS